MPSTPPSTKQLFVIALICFAGCDFPGRPNPADRPVPADQVLSFSVLYGQNCAGCHGAGGKLGPAPPLNDDLFRAIVPAAEIAGVVTRGRHQSLMPALAKENGGALTATQIQVLVHEIKGIPYKVITKQEGELVSTEVVADTEGTSPKWGPIGKPPADVPAYHLATPAEGIDSAASIQRGEIAFARACATCHGMNGQGIVDETKTRRTINDPVALRLMSDQFLRRIVITGRPDLGMPNFAGARPDSERFEPLTDQEVTDLVALLASWRQSADQHDLVKE